MRSRCVTRKPDASPPATPLKKLHLNLTGSDRLFRPMRIADVCAFYTPMGGGVRTYVEAKLRAASAFGQNELLSVLGEVGDQLAFCRVTRGRISSVILA